MTTTEDQSIKAVTRAAAGLALAVHSSTGMDL